MIRVLMTEKRRDLPVNERVKRKKWRKQEVILITKTSDNADMLIMISRGPGEASLVLLAR